MNNNMITDKHNHDNGYISLINVNLRNVPEKIETDGYKLLKKGEFHVSIMALKNLAPMLGQQEKRNLEMQLEQEARRRRQAEAESDQLRERLERTDSIQLASPNDRPMTEPGPLSRATFEPRLADTDKSDASTPMTRKVNTLESAPEQAAASRNGDYESRKESRKEQMKEERERLKEQRSQEKELQKDQREREKEARKQQREEEREDKKHRDEMAREQKKHDEEMRKLDGEKHKREKE